MEFFAMMEASNWVFLLAGFLIGGLCFAFWIWMLVHAIVNRGLTDPERLMWVILIVFLPLLGSLIYVFVGFSKRPPPPTSA